MTPGLRSGEPADVLSAAGSGRSYYRELLLRMLRHLVPEQKRVLDLGCGEGEFLARLNPAFGVGVDIRPDAVASARQRFPELNWKVADIESMDIDEQPFEYILLINTIGFVEDIQAVFRGMRKYSRPDTRIVIVHYNYLWEPILKLAELLGLKKKEPYLNWISIGDMENLLYIEGFETLRKRQSMLFPLNIPILSFIFNRVVGNLPLLWRLGLVSTIVARLRPEQNPVPASSCSVIVPARNERGNISAIAVRIPEMGSHTEIIFVEGHSGDGTREEIERVIGALPQRDVKLFVQDGEGKADAVRKGFALATGDILMILDADMTVRPEELPKFFECIESGKGELVIGCRLVYQLAHESMRFLNLAGNKFFSLAFSYLLDQRIKDTLCGTKAVRRGQYRMIAENRKYLGEFDPFGDFDLLFGAARANLRIVEIPVRYHARTYGETQIRRFRHGFMLLRMVLVAIRKLKFI